MGRINWPPFFRVTENRRMRGSARKLSMNALSPNGFPFTD